MADAKKEEKKEAAPAKAAAPKKKGGAAGLIILMTLLGAMTPFLYPSVFMLIGMLPTLVVLFTSNDRQGASVTAVGALNAAGITPFVIDLWQKGQTMENAWLIMRAPETWLVILGAAAVGQLILFAVPQAIAAASFANAETRIRRLKDNLETLKTTWGADVATTKSLEKVARGE